MAKCYKLSLLLICTNDSVSSAQKILENKSPARCWHMLVTLALRSLGQKRKCQTPLSYVWQFCHNTSVWGRSSVVKRRFSGLKALGWIPQYCPERKENLLSQDYVSK